MEKVILVEPDKEQGEVFVNWLKEENYEVKPVDDAREVLPLLLNEKFGSVIIDTDAIDPAVKLHRAINENAYFSGISLFVLIYRTRVKEIVGLIDAGVESLLFKPFDVNNFADRLKTVTKEVEFAKRGKKLLDQNYINSLIKVAGETGREDFFPLVHAIFNKSIVEKTSTILGRVIITQIVKRANEIIGEDYAFMKEIKYSENRISMDDMEKTSKEVAVEKLTMAFRDYIYAFLHMVRMLTSDILVEREGVG
ncbi:MAG: hypothetical protein KJ995_04575 [Candidatus Omnitrophica bacterium]|nr:hypothetical protein [Candidatus Omnitrophota bacterium]